VEAVTEPMSAARLAEIARIGYSAADLTQDHVDRLGAAMRGEPMDPTEDRPPRGAEPLGLSPEAAGAPDRGPVEAWIAWTDGRNRRQLVDVLAVTERAALVAWTDPDGDDHVLWIWRNAIREES
jgi:hypothetical protein